MNYDATLIRAAYMFALGAILGIILLVILMALSQEDDPPNDDTTLTVDESVLWSDADHSEVVVWGDTGLEELPQASGLVRPNSWNQ